MRGILGVTNAISEFVRITYIGAAVLAATTIAGCNGGSNPAPTGEQSTASAAESAAAPAPSLPFSGTFTGNLAGSPVKLVLEQNGDQLSGRISSGLQVSTVTGTATGNKAKARMQDPDGTGGDVELSRDGEALNMKLTITDPASGNSATLDVAFKPAASASTSTAQTGNSNDAAERDTMLIGRWLYTDAGGSGGFTYAIDTWMTINEDGTYRYGDSKMGAGDASFSSVNESSDAEVGKWKTEDRILYFRTDANNEWVPIAKYYAEADRIMLTYNNGSKRVWERR